MKNWKSFEEERTGARSKALVLLADMDRTEAGLRSRLLRSGFSDEAAEDALSYVKSYGYVDDARYARNYAGHMQQKKGMRRIEADLIQKGVPRDIVDEVLGEHEAEDERPVIRALAKKRLRGETPADPRVYNRVASYLARRGFRSGDIVSVLRELQEDNT